jgi:hypothetical protein
MRTTSRAAENAALHHALGQLLNEQGNAVGAFDDLLGNLLGQRLAAGHIGDHLGALPARQAIQRQHRHLGAADPGRRELRPEGDDHQHPQPGHPIHEKVEGLARGGIAPMHVLPYHQHRLTRRQPLELCQLGVKRPLLALLRREIERRIAVACRDRQQIGQQRNGLAGARQQAHRWQPRQRAAGVRYFRRPIAFPRPPYGPARFWHPQNTLFRTEVE